MKNIRIVALLLAMVLLLGACGQAGTTATMEPDPEVDVTDVLVPESDLPTSLPPELENDAYTDTVKVGELDANEAKAVQGTGYEYKGAEHPGTLTAVDKKDRAVIDYSNTKAGYVMVQYKQDETLRLKAQVKGPTTTYTYDITPKTWTTFPLSDGNGEYTIAVLRNAGNPAKPTSYAKIVSVTVKVELDDEFGPFLYSNQYVDFENAPETQKKAAELVKDITDPLKKVEAVYSFVVKNFSYDDELAATVQSGYLPVLDTVLSKKTGICFDYAAIMTGMLRSQGVPCKLVVGYAGKAYHAWISVYSEDDGWIEGVIYFNGSAWERMDPTFASSSNSSEKIMKYIGDGKNYSAKYFY